MDILRSFVINLSVTIIFFTAIKLILPSNSIKKYVSFVMGIMLIAVMLQPIITIFTSEDKLTAKIEKNLQTNNINLEKSNNNINESKKAAVLKNIENEAIRLLKGENADKDFKVKINGSVDVEKVVVDIKGVEVWVSDSKNIKKVQKVQIGKESKEEPLNDDFSDKIKVQLSKALSISKDKIIIYKD
ncbi:stage III sporulation protein AF [Clostridium cavendishii DSM 21758]|uniref:Stage III sporulation protein AF n=1 Tax=Clostridium cavendishii DSM 21758 TaxID=1121302 RepID=A0A1M6KL18_9CLOT|nr:stage III sporulation protein AF [Clostridium cavendishii]SHJ59540.1 stage III sporulation protein AF [Clostridium cavendishii DSM 21758]